MKVSIQGMVVDDYFDKNKGSLDDIFQLHVTKKEQGMGMGKGIPRPPPARVIIYKLSPLAMCMIRYCKFNKYQLKTISCN